jgi:hypothetical protein
MQVGHATHRVYDNRISIKVPFAPCSLVGNVSEPVELGSQGYMVDQREIHSCTNSKEIIP